jgi:hypothetical protein
MILIVNAHCHGRGRGFEPRRPRQILKDLGPIWHVATRYNRIHEENTPLISLVGIGAG